MTPLLDVQHLTVTFERQGSRTTAVDDLNLTIEAGETLGLVGESGSGKSVTALAILRLLQPPGRVSGGRVLFEGRDLLSLSEAEMRPVRGGRISLIFQEPMTALNPDHAGRRPDCGSAHRAWSWARHGASTHD